MYEDVFASISCHFNTFTRAERGIANYVAAHGKEMLNMSISRLAQLCDVSESSIVRFCRHLGMNGYRDFRTALAMSLCAREQTLEQESADSAADNVLTVQVRRMYKSCVQAMHETYQLLRLDHLQEAAKRLMLSDFILLIGMGDSQLSAINAYKQMAMVAPRVCCPLDAFGPERLHARDAVILFAQNDSPPALVDIAKSARRKGCYLLLISPFIKTPLSALADHTLLCGGHTKTDTAIFTQAFLMELLCKLYLQQARAARRPVMQA